MAYNPTSITGYGATSTGTGAPNVANPSDPTAFLNNTLPGFTQARTSAMGNIQNLLTGLPSVDQTRTANAYFGANSGMPGSDFIRNRGYDLYGQQAQQNTQTGLSNLTSLLGSVSQPTLTNQGQQLQNTQFNQNLSQQNNQYQQDLQLKNFLANLQSLGLGAEITNPNKQITIPQFNF